METEAKIHITSSELGSLWMIYVGKSAGLLICDLFKSKTIDKEAQSILTDFFKEAQNIKNEITNLLNYEKAVIPKGFDERDVISESPPLFDDIFYIMYLRHMMKLNFAYNGVYSGISYMKEVNDVLKLNYDISNKYYMMTTNYLLGKGAIARPPFVTMPKEVEFVEDKNYMSGFNIFSDKRSLNTIEVGYINEAIEYNIFGMELLTGFAQVAKEKDVRKYFIEGKELSKKNISILSNMLSESDIQPPSTWAGKVTDSTQAPFSDKLMMFLNSLISCTSIGFTSLGTSFSMRSDIPAKLGLISKNTFDYSRKGAKIMIAHKWMEEPPQMEDRNQLTK